MGEEAEELGRERMGRKSSAMLVGIIWMFTADMFDDAVVVRRKKENELKQNDSGV